MPPLIIPPTTFLSIVSEWFPFCGFLVGHSNHYLSKPPATLPHKNAHVLYMWRLSIAILTSISACITGQVYTTVPALRLYICFLPYQNSPTPRFLASLANSAFLIGFPLSLCTNVLATWKKLAGDIPSYFPSLMLGPILPQHIIILTVLIDLLGPCINIHRLRVCSLVALFAYLHPLNQGVCIVLRCSGNSRGFSVFTGGPAT